MAESREKTEGLASEINQKFKDAMLAKAPYTERWIKYMSIWDNSMYENKSTPSYKSNQHSNFIFSTIESIRPIMFDGDPKFEAVPVTLQGVDYAHNITQVLDYEWHRANMKKIMIGNSIPTLVLGTSIIMLTYDVDDGVDGNVKPIPVNPFNIYPDPLATSVEDAEYIIYATYIHENILKRDYPEFADEISGSRVEYSELVDFRDKDANISNQVLVLEFWSRDYTSIEEEDDDGNKTSKAAYPNGRVITVLPELNLVIDDKDNPYNTGRFPFFLFKDIDVPFQFWGEGEVRWLLSPQEAINDLSNQIIDNARHTANQIWVIDKNAGVPKGTLTNRPGLIIRKNPGTSVERSTPPSMPMYVSEKINSLKMDIEVISGVHDVTRGQNPTGLESGAAIMALQEAAQTRIRLKINLQEEYLAELGQEWFERIRQFWVFDRLIPQDGAPQPETGEKTYDFLEISQDEQLAESYKIKIIGTSTMGINNSSMFDLMIRLAQTMADDGMPMVTRDAVLDYLPKVNKDRILHHFKVKEQKMMEQQQQRQMSEQQVGEIQGILGELINNMQGMNKDLSNVQGKMAQEDDARAQDELRSQGYDMGMAEGIALKDNELREQIPEELIEMLSGLDDNELMEFLEDNPELASII